MNGKQRLKQSLALPLQTDHLLDVADAVGLLHADQRLQLAVLVLEDLAVAEVIGQLQRALVSGIADLADLGRLVLLPPLAVELQVELPQALQAGEVHEGVAHVPVALHKMEGTFLSMGR